MPHWIRVTTEGDCPLGALKGVVADGVPIVLTNVDGTVCALRDQCSHEDLPLSDGELDDDEIVCVYHGARFDARSGARRALPAVAPVQSFPVELRDGAIYVDVG